MSDFPFYKYSLENTTMASKSERYLNAMKDVKDNGLTVRAAAKKWGVPKSSLYDRLSGRVEYYRRSGPPTVLTKEEETRLAEWLVEMERRGCAFCKDDIFDHVKKMLDDDKRETQFTDNRPGNKWFRSFLARNNNIQLKSMRPHEKKRAKNLTSDSNGWFSGYEKLIQEHGLADSPTQIWKCFETSFDLQGRHGKIMGISEKPYRDSTDTKEQLTLLTCFNACGQWIPPYIVIPGKRAPKTYNPLEGGAPGSAFSVTEKGNMDASAFYLWLDDHFIPNIPPARPVVLLVDSHNSHINPGAFELAKKYCIEIFGSTSLVGEMAGDGFPRAMKKTWYKHERKYNKKNPNTDITKKNFCSVFRSTWEDVMRPGILTDAFRQSGLYPLDKTPVSDDRPDTYSSAAPCSPSLVTMATSEVVAVVEIDSTISETATHSSSEQP